MKEQNGDLKISQGVPNEFGETAIDFAPHITLTNGYSAIPQQFLRTEHSIDTLEAIVARIKPPAGFIVFVGRVLNELFIQIGIVGNENYPKQNNNNRIKIGQPDQKIVYSRRWVIEKSSPTSEVIQTVLLAIKKAREHELREKIYLKNQANDGWTTPFNCHIDLPLMAANRSLFETADLPQVSLSEEVKQFRVSNLRVQIVNEPIPVEDNYLILVKLVHTEKSPETSFHDLADKTLYLMLSELSSNELIHEFVSELISVSDRYVEERFEFNGFKRFSRSLSALAISKFSRATRVINSFDTVLRKSYEDLNYEIDSKRVPKFSGGELGDIQRYQIFREGNLAGHLPSTLGIKDTSMTANFVEIDSEWVRKSRAKSIRAV